MPNTNAFLPILPTDGYVPYSRLIPLFQTGDLLLWHGADDFSLGTRQRTHSLFSHIGMVVVLPEVLYGEPLFWHIAPSRNGEVVFLPPEDVFAAGVTITQKTIEVPTKKRTLQHAAKLVPLFPTLKRFLAVKYSYSYRKLHLPQGLTITPAVCEFIRRIEGAAFTSFDLDDIWREYQMGKEGVRHDNPSFACGELISATLMHCGILSTEHLPNAYWPADLSSENPTLPLLRGARYEPEQWFNLE